MPFLLNEDLWLINADKKRIEEKNRDPDTRNQQNIKPSRIKYIKYKKNNKNQYWRLRVKNFNLK